MDSQQKTAEYFRDKSESEIIDWMLKNLSSNQIRSCLGDEIPEQITPTKIPEINVETLRQYCANKPYIIHKIKDGKVYFWYFEKTKWIYYNKDLTDFPTTEGGKAKECDPTDILTDQEQIDRIDNKYIYSNIQYAINVQKQFKVNVSPLSDVFTYTPVLIESALGKNIYFYYLDWIIDDDDILKVIIKGEDDVEKIHIDECPDRFESILEKWMLLNDKIIPDGEPGPSDKYSPSHIKELIKTTVKNKMEIKKFVNDFESIKSNYDEFKDELSSKYFMENLFTDTSRFGETKNYDNIEEYVVNYYGKTFSKLFKPNIVENKFGVKTIHYSLR